ncbi:MAG: hypothetical protein V3S30_04515 [Thermoanaerobaculia bacterium]
MAFPATEGNGCGLAARAEGSVPAASLSASTGGAVSTAWRLGFESTFFFADLFAGFADFDDLDGFDNFTGFVD